MRIKKEDIDAIAQLLKDGKWDNKIVVHDSGLSYVSVKDLLFFDNHFQFEDYIQQRNLEGKVSIACTVRQLNDGIDAVKANGIDFKNSDLFHYSDGVLTIPKTMNAEVLKDQLRSLGFEERIFPALNFYISRGHESFDLLQRERTASEKSQYHLHFVQQPGSMDYRLTGYEGILRIAPEIPDVTINGINAKELDLAMKSVDWSIDHHRESLVEEYVKTAEGRDFLDKLRAIVRDVNRLYESNTEGKDAGERLMYKHWYGEPWEPAAIPIQHVCKIYEWKKEVDLTITPDKRVSETYEALKEHALLSNGALPINREALAGCLDKEAHQIQPGEELVILARHFDKINIHCLETALYKNGWDQRIGDELQRHLKNQSGHFEVAINNEARQDKMQCRLQFEDAGNGWYLFKEYDATLYQQVAIEHAHINGINTAYLEEAMKKADWHYEHCVFSGDWKKGFAEVSKINEAVNSLCRDEKGRIIATQLWNNHVPLFRTAKPVIILKCEEEHKLYPTMRFAPGTHVYAAHQELKHMLIKNEMQYQQNNSIAKQETPAQQVGKDTKHERINAARQKYKENPMHKPRQKIK